MKRGGGGEGGRGVGGGGRDEVVNTGLHPTEWHSSKNAKSHSRNMCIWLLLSVLNLFKQCDITFNVHNILKKIHILPLFLGLKVEE